MRSFASGSVLMRPSETGDWLGIVLEGALRLALPRAECSVGVLTIPEWRLIKPGEVVGEVALFAGRMRSATVVAARESAVAILQYDAIAALGGKLSETICTRLAAVAARRVAEDVPGPLSPVGATTTPRHPQSSVRRVEATWSARQMASAATY
mgnify:FL=1